MKISNNKDIIGLERGIVELVNHNLNWKKIFNKETKKIKNIFQKDCVDIQHIGSTSIPKILAKPIIDISLIIPSFKKIKFYQKKLEEIGYDLKKDGKRLDRIFFTKGPEKKRTHYLHISEINSSYANDMIIFRDYLCNNKDVAKKYSDLKKELSIKYKNNRKVYTEKKSKFINKIIKDAKKLLKNNEKRNK